jgi:hypothetical protein
MKRYPNTQIRRVVLALLASVIALISVPSAFMQQSGGPYTLNPSVIPGGSGTSTDANTRLDGTIGQPVVGSSTNGTFTVDGGVVPASSPCLSLSRILQAFNASGGPGSVNVLGPNGCNWTAVSNDPTIVTITSGASGFGNGTVTFSVAANSNTTNRQGTITVAGQIYTVLEGAAFLDVPSNNPFYNEIGTLSAYGVTVGCGNGNYCPNDPVLREQMAAFIIRALGDFDPAAPAQQRFNDVPPSNVFYAFIEEMAQRQITLGCGGGNYCPAQPVLREQMAAFIIRALGEFSPPTPPSQRFNDVPPSNVFYNFIDRMAVLQITLGCTPDHSLYCPGDSVTRAQMAAFLVRAFQL